MITVIDKNNLHELPKTLPGLSRALDKTSLSKFWSVDKLYEEMSQGSTFVFHQEESHFSGVVTIGSAPLGDILFFFWGGKCIDNINPIDYLEVDQFLVHSAKNLGCRFIQCEGRKGWKKILTTFGYSEDSVNYIKEVTL